MDYKKSGAPVSTITRNPDQIGEVTGNLYEAIAVISKRANQISLDIKKQLSEKLEEFASSSDNLEEIFENREQIEISRFYERLPKPNAIAMDEFMGDKIYYRQGENKKKDFKKNSRK